MFDKTWHLFILLLIVHLFHVTSQCGPAFNSQDEKLALYKIILRTYWSRERFPKHYPQWSPPAQFGKLVGRTHDSTYSLYHLGERLSLGTLQYVETGSSDGLDIDSDLSSVLDSFGGPRLLQGEGTTVSRAFFDGNHTLVSIIMRINPSPDWFIGVDSFSLCVKEKWVDTVTLELDPLDGGTDNGLTFTARNWPTKPQGVPYRITSRYPANRAGSFYYPNLSRLPPIATLTFQKLKEYTVNGTFHHESKNNDIDIGFVTSENEAIERNNKYRYWTARDFEKLKKTQESENKKGIIMDKIASSYGTSRGRIFPQSIVTNNNNINEERKKITRKMVGAMFLGNDVHNVLPSSPDFPIKNSTIFHANEHHHGLRKNKHNRGSTLVNKGKRYKSHLSRDCKVGEWSAWNACSRSCGVGETQRTRKVMVKPRRGGQSCPSLKEIKWCGSISPCPLIK